MHALRIGSCPMAHKSRKRQGVVEYALILILAVVVVVTAIAVLGDTTAETLGNVANTWENAT